MTALNTYSFARSATWVLPLLLCAQSNALGRAGGFQNDPPFSRERIHRLSSEVQSAVRHMCAAIPTAAHYFAAYSDNAHIVKLRFEELSCDGHQIHHELDRCLREEFVRTGTHYHLLKTYYAQCGD